jgi:hypothetical protein
MGSYIYTFLKNPGIPINKEITMEMTRDLEENKNSRNKKGGYKFCNICHIYIDKNSNTNHCEDCNVCIEGNNYLIIN